MSNNLHGIVLALTAFASYSLMDATIKYIGEFTTIPWQVLIFNVSVVILITLFISIALSKEGSFKVHRPFWLFVRAAIGVFNLHLVFFIVPKVNLDLFYSLVFISPILASILATFVLGEHLNIHKIISIATGFIGILVITRPWDLFSEMQEFSFLELVPLLVALTDAAIGIIARKYLINDRPTTLVFYQFILCTIVSGSLAFFTTSAPPVVALPNIPLVGLTVLFALGGYLFYVMAVQKAPIQVVLPMAYSQMPFGIVLSIFIFHKQPELHIILGAAIIILASMYMMFYAARVKS